jgi:hypothetical protein
VHLKSLVGSFGFLLLSATSVFAADIDEAQNVGGTYGNLHVGAFAFLNETDDTTTRVPGLNIGGKIAVDQSDSPWGWQLDGDISYLDFDWVKPSIEDVEGHINVVDTAAHLTYRPNTSTKLGLFAGYGSITLEGEDTTTTESASLTIGAATLGVEALTDIGENTWVQARAGLIDPVYIKASYFDGITRDSVSKTDIFGKNIGGMANASLHHRFSDSTSGRVEAAYTRIGIDSESDINMISIGLTGNYTFDQMPLTLAATGGYSALVFDDLDSDGIFVRTSAIWSFGGPSSGSTGKLFRSGALGFAN